MKCSSLLLTAPCTIRIHFLYRFCDNYTVRRIDVTSFRPFNWSKAGFSDVSCFPAVPDVQRSCRSRLSDSDSSAAAAGGGADWPTRQPAAPAYRDTAQQWTSDTTWIVDWTIGHGARPTAVDVLSRVETCNGRNLSFRVFCCRWCCWNEWYFHKFFFRHSPGRRRTGCFIAVHLKITDYGLNRNNIFRSVSNWIVPNDEESKAEEKTIRDIVDRNCIPSNIDVINHAI